MLIVFLLVTCLSISRADVIRETTLFAKRLCGVLPYNGQNLVFSPISIHASLSLLYQGAAGQTATDIAKVLSLPNATATAIEYKDFIEVLNTRGNVTIEFADKIYVGNKFPILKSFKDTAKEYFSSEAENINFGNREEAATAINTWIRSKIHDKMNNLISAEDLSPLTSIVLTNTIYFKGLWNRPFLKSATKIQKFYTSPSKTVECEMMSQENIFFYWKHDELDAQLLRIPYKDSNFSMLILLPNDNVDINMFKRRLIKFDINSVLTNMVEMHVALELPKFKVESTFDLKNTLSLLGLSGIFDDFADFSPMGYHDLHVDKIVQKAFIEVNEGGSQAGTSTATIASTRQAPLHFIVNRPFMFSIIAEQKEYERVVILFYGGVTTFN